MKQNVSSKDVRELNATELDATTGAGQIIIVDCSTWPRPVTSDGDLVINPWINGRTIINRGPLL